MEREGDKLRHKITNRNILMAEVERRGPKPLPEPLPIFMDLPRHLQNEVTSHNEKNVKKKNNEEDME